MVNQGPAMAMVQIVGQPHPAESHTVAQIVDHPFSFPHLWPIDASFFWGGGLQANASAPLHTAPPHTRAGSTTWRRGLWSPSCGSCASTGPSRAPSGSSPPTTARCALDPPLTPKQWDPKTRRANSHVPRGTLLTRKTEGGGLIMKVFEFPLFAIFKMRLLVYVYFFGLFCFGHRGFSPITLLPKNQVYFFFGRGSKTATIEEGTPHPHIFVTVEPFHTIVVPPSKPPIHPQAKCIKCLLPKVYPSAVNLQAVFVGTTDELRVCGVGDGHGFQGSP